MELTVEHKEPKPICEWEYKMLNLFNTLCIVESNDCEIALNLKENAIGVVQIRPIAIRELNRLYLTDFRHDMAYDRGWSLVFFMLMMKHYNPTGDYEIGSRVWNGGAYGYNNPNTYIYWVKVKRLLEKKNIA
jgi:hypothetical protein